MYAVLDSSHNLEDGKLRRIALLTTIFSLGCASAPVVSESEPVLIEPVQVTLGPVAHEGPMSIEPGFYDCGDTPLGYVCEFEARVIINTGSVVIEEIGQDFSPYARVSLVQESTGFNRELPYEMLEEDVLLALFYYRRDEAGEVTGGSLQIRYSAAGQDYRLVVPIGGD